MDVEAPRFRYDNFTTNLYLVVHPPWVLGIVEFRGTMTDCPEKLTTGASLIVTLRAYILAPAFTLPSTSKQDDNLKPVVFNEGLETIDEK